MSRTRWALTAALVGSTVLVSLVVTGVYDPSGDSVADAIVFLVGAPTAAYVSFSLGLAPRKADGLIGIAVLTAALEVGDVNPFPAMITIGFWLVGRAARSHRQLATALRTRAYELESGREAFTYEARRNERARIAREMHDIVAHSLSVMVIQASAGQRLGESDPDGSEIRTGILHLADEVRRDLAGLSRLLGADLSAAPLLSRHSINELVERTASTGSVVTSQIPDGLDELSPGVAAIAYRVLQEGLTNAIKHAPGAPIEVTVHLTTVVSLTVVNGASPLGSAEPAAPGSGRGLAGLAERVTCAHGVFAAGSTPQNGWMMSVELPLRADLKTLAPA
jgi:signal transduction histidine kinase